MKPILLYGSFAIGVFTLVYLLACKKRDSIETTQKVNERSSPSFKAINNTIAEIETN